MPRNFGSSKICGSLTQFSSFQSPLKPVKSFQKYSWLLTYPGLAYSKYFDGAFCLPCVCFGLECGKNGDRLDKLLKTPLTLWTTAVVRLRNHSTGKCETHNFSVVSMASFMANMTRATVPIDQQLNQLVQRQINDNREKIKSIIKIVIFCGQNNFPPQRKER